MRAVCCCLLLTIFQLLDASLAATIPAASLLTQYDNADANPTNPSNSTHLVTPMPSSELGFPAPAAPYRVLQGAVSLKFYDYDAALPPNPTRELVHMALARISVEHGAYYSEEIGREVVYSLELIGGPGTLSFSVEPEANMTWGMFATAAAGVTRFLQRWDNVEFAVDVSMREDVGGKVGTAYLQLL